MTDDVLTTRGVEPSTFTDLTILQTGPFDYLHFSVENNKKCRYIPDYQMQFVFSSNNPLKMDQCEDSCQRLDIKQHTRYPAVHRI